MKNHMDVQPTKASLNRRGPRRPLLTGRDGRMDKGLGLRVQSLGFRVQALGFRVQDLGPGFRNKGAFPRIIPSPHNEYRLLIG